MNLGVYDSLLVKSSTPCKRPPGFHAHSWATALSVEFLPLIRARLGTAHL